MPAKWLGTLFGALIVCSTGWAQTVITVAGSVGYKDRSGQWIGAPNREVDLYGVSGKAGPSVASDVSSEVGTFELVAKFDMEGEIAFVADKDDAAPPVRVHIPKAGGPLRQSEKVKLEIECDASKGSVHEADLKKCITASGQAHRVKVQAHVESPEAGAELFAKRAHALLMNVPQWSQADVKDALAEIERPYAGIALPVLPSATKDLILGDAKQLWRAAS